MRRPIVSILILAALLVSDATHSAEARPKSFCRKWAAGVANNNLGYEEQARALPAGQAAPPTLARQDPAKARPLAGNGLGGTFHRIFKPARWHEIYRQAYAHCRVVQN